MKKTCSIFLMMLSVLFLISCSSTTTYTISNSDALKTPAVYTYTVSVVSQTPSNSTEVTNSSVTLEIDSDKSYLKTEVSIEENNQYSLTNTLHIVGNYKFGDEDHNFTDDKVSKTLYTVSAQKVNFISTTKTCTNETLYYSSNQTLTQSAYSYTITYGDNAVVNFTADENSAFSYLNGEVTLKKYNSKIYVDNEFISFLPRALDDSSLSISFNSVDAMSSSLKSLSYTMDSSSKIVDGFKYKYSSDDSFSVSSVKSGDTVQENKASVFKVTTALSDRFSGNSLESYYLNGSGIYDHLLVESYTLLNDTIGYIKYKLDSAVISN